MATGVGRGRICLTSILGIKWKDRVTNMEVLSQTGQRRLQDIVTDWLSMVLRLRQHNIGYRADGFYRSDDPTNSVKALKEGG